MGATVGVSTGDRLNLASRRIMLWDVYVVENGVVSRAVPHALTTNEMEEFCSILGEQVVYFVTRNNAALSLVFLRTLSRIPD